MACEIDHVLAQVELLVDVPHGGGFGVHALVGLGVVLIEVGHEDEELSEASLLEHAHQICTQCRGSMVVRACDLACSPAGVVVLTYWKREPPIRWTAPCRSSLLCRRNCPRSP